MLHACFYTICLVFCYTSWHFYAFSGTNLLTRCHSTSSLVSAVFFQKSYTGNILGIGQNKSRTSKNFTEASREPKRRRSGPIGQPHHRAVRPAPGSRPLVVRPPWPTSDDAPSPIKTPRREKPKHPIIFSEYIAIRRHRRPEIGRVQKLFPAPCRRGESPPEVIFIAMLASGAMSE
jgi:hypothetical protein